MQFRNPFPALLRRRRPSPPADVAAAPNEPPSARPAKADEKPTNPYLDARRAWNEHVGAILESRQSWQMIGMLSLLIALAAVGGNIYIGSQSKYIPYAVEVDRLGRAQGMGIIQPTTQTDPRIVQTVVNAFISNARMVTPDRGLQRKAVFALYAHISGTDPAFIKMNEWLNGTPESSPFARAEKEMVSAEIKSVLQQTPETWQVEWIENRLDRKGARIGAPTTWRALVTAYVAAPDASTTEKQMQENPLGVYIRDFSWSQLR